MNRLLKLEPILPLPKATFESKQIPLGAWKSRQFLAVLYLEPGGFKRLTVNKVTKNNRGEWEDGITWDALQEIKSQIGLGDAWGLEVYPAEKELVHDSNMRHIFIFETAPLFAWVGENS